MKFSPSRTALSGLALTVAATALAQPLLAPAAQAATDVPATSAARAGTGWLATQLTDGVIHNDTYDFDDLGMTMDIGLSMDEVGGDQAMVRQIRSSLSTRVQEYAAPSSTAPPSATPSETPSADTAPVPVEPVIMPEAADGETFAVMRIPRFGADYAWQVAGGVTRARTLDPIGIGHYPGTPMPGDVGNFAVAAHRTTWGAPFNRIAELHVNGVRIVADLGTAGQRQAVHREVAGADREHQCYRKGDRAEATLHGPSTSTSPASVLSTRSTSTGPICL